MRRTRINFRRSALDDLGRHQARSADRHDLVVVALDAESRHVEMIFEEIGEIREVKSIAAPASR